MQIKYRFFTFLIVYLSTFFTLQILNQFDSLVVDAEVFLKVALVIICFVTSLRRIKLDRRESGSIAFHLSFRIVIIVTVLFRVLLLRDGLENSDLDWRALGLVRVLLLERFPLMLGFVPDGLLRLVINVVVGATGTTLLEPLSRRYPAVLLKARGVDGRARPALLRRDLL